MPGRHASNVGCGVASALALEARRIPTRDRRQRRIGDQHCARAANAIVALAQRYGAQVVMEDFSRLNDRRIPPPLRPILRGRQFQKLARFIDERLEVAGLPHARQVSAYAISLDCLRCGARQDAGAVVKSEHPRQFVCAGCGETQDRDVSAAANVARRFVWLQQRGVERRAGIASEQRTTWETFAAAHPMLELRTPADD